MKIALVICGPIIILDRKPNAKQAFLTSFNNHILCSWHVGCVSLIVYGYSSLEHSLPCTFLGNCSVLFCNNQNVWNTYNYGSLFFTMFGIQMFFLFSKVAYKICESLLQVIHLKCEFYFDELWISVNEQFSGIWNPFQRFFYSFSFAMHCWSWASVCRCDYPLIFWFFSFLSIY